MSQVCSYTNLSGMNASSTAHEQITRFLVHVGKKPLCNIDYTPISSGGYAAGQSDS